MFQLTVYMDTNNVCPIVYNNQQYCYDNDELEICLNFETRKDAINHLKLIEVPYGYESSKLVRDFIEEFIEIDMNEYQASDLYHHSDRDHKEQVFVICIKHITEIDPSNKYVGSKIINIRRGHAERQKFIYADLVSAKGELLIGATLDYIYKALNERL